MPGNRHQQLFAGARRRRSASSGVIFHAVTNARSNAKAVPVSGSKRNTKTHLDAETDAQTHAFAQAHSAADKLSAAHAGTDTGADARSNTDACSDAGTHANAHTNADSDTNAHADADERSDDNAARFADAAARYAAGLAHTACDGNAFTRADVVGFYECAVSDRSSTSVGRCTAGPRSFPEPERYPVREAHRR